MVLTRAMQFVAMASTILIANGSQAQPYGGYPGMGPGMAPPGYLEPPGFRDPREGKIDAHTYVAATAAASALGRGPIVVAAKSVGFGDGLYESALVDQLARAGYQMNGASAPGGQIVEFVVTHELVQPPEPPHNPVSGGAAIGAGNYGSGFGLGLNIDLSKPLRALIANRLEVRIHDAATHELLWQGQAEVLAREGDKHWTEQALAARLSAALFKDFPRPIHG